MKVKLLKKIRKRFDWYIRKDGVPIVLDLDKELIIIFTDSTLVTLNKYKDEEDMKKQVEIPMEAFRWRMAKDYIYKEFGYSIVKAMFRQSRRLAKQYVPFKSKTNV